MRGRVNGTWSCPILDKEWLVLVTVIKRSVHMYAIMTRKCMQTTAKRAGATVKLARATGEDGSEKASHEMIDLVEEANEEENSGTEVSGKIKSSQSLQRMR